MRRIGAVVIAAQLCACSFAFVHGPPPDQPKRSIESKGADRLVCTDSKLVPGLDSVFTGLVAINLFYAVGSSDDSQLFRKSIGIPLFVLAGLAGGAGMYYGFTRVSACQKMHDQLIKDGVEKPELPRPGTLVVPTAPL